MCTTIFRIHLETCLDLDIMDQIYIFPRLVQCKKEDHYYLIINQCRNSLCHSHSPPLKSRLHQGLIVTARQGPVCHLDSAQVRRHCGKSTAPPPDVRLRKAQFCLQGCDSRLQVFLTAVTAAWRSLGEGRRCSQSRAFAFITSSW